MKALALLLLLAACAPGRGPQTVYPGQYIPEHGPSALSRAPRTLIEVRPLLDVPDVAPGALGEVRDDQGNVVQTLTLAPPPGRQFTDAFQAELQAAGHTVTGAGAPAVLEGSVQRFAFAATPNKVTWDSRLTAQVAVKLTYRGRSETRAYTATCNDAGLIRPSPEAVAGISATCIANIARQFRNDPGMGRLLSGG